MRKLLEKLNQLLLPIVIIIASIILGGFFYASQVNKQRSIDHQQEAENALENLKLKQDECKALSAGVMKKWNNVIGVTYDNGFWKECIVTYTNTETGKIETSPLRFMETSK